ncbi:phosphoribosylanthranilate isomerase [Oceanicoccus sagamiensis]|uniref:N-(5'-phosphoribosyl)anthranilate isomerase n=1 Tax=Oceanicoccus sagamiensis TaxID=716816 RepID=A0A1X9NEN4_9GAMM|nr:phosphoribosylanthranilate isomerase [Oceanicoccus sagamiensis]ARN76498.1 N-(5'-phosphoribosyl)anthranilate isomerase [Oceanicoccus sagamiensis]
MSRTRIKICGITSPADALLAIEAGADAIGLVFYAPSSRSVTVAQAAEICAVIPAFVTIVALTVDAEPALMQQITTELPIDLLQFHGKESPEQCAQSGRPYMKAIRMRPELNLDEEIARFANARSILLDAYRKGVPGGTGESFDWDLIPAQYRSRIVLAGGLTPANIVAAVTQVKPYAVDVSGGVEASAGSKDNTKLVEFIEGVRRADASLG